MTALYFLSMFYFDFRDELSDWNPLSKFACIKLVVFFTYWQGLTVSILVYSGLLSQISPAISSISTGELSEGLQNLLITIEMVGFATVHYYAFGVRQFMVSGFRDTEILESIRALFHMSDVKSDLSLVTNKQGYERLRVCSACSSDVFGSEYGAAGTERATLASGHGLQHTRDASIVDAGTTMNGATIMEEPQCSGEADEDFFEKRWKR